MTDICIHLSPDCRDGKCRACVGDAWCHDEDARVVCECECHEGVIAS